MKFLSLFFALFLFPLLLSAQDTIFFRTGQVIPAIIIEKNKTEIKYKKFGPPESAAIYSAFVSDLMSIHYKDGIIADYTLAGQPGTEVTKQKAIEKAGTMNSIKWSFGAGAEYFNRNSKDDLLEFWKFRTGDPNETIEGNPIAIPISLKMNMALGNMKRNWIGDELKFIIFQKDAINAVNSDGSYEISMGNVYSSISMYYGRSLNEKNNLIAIIEPGLDISFSMTGTMKLNNVIYKETGMGMGFHIATGLDWLISKRFTASLRGGYRSMKIHEEHKDEAAQYGFSNFHNASGKLLTYGWNGPYANFVIQWSFYSTMKSNIPAK